MGKHTRARRRTPARRTKEPSLPRTIVGKVVHWVGPTALREVWTWIRDNWDQILEWISNFN